MCMLILMSKTKRICVTHNGVSSMTHKAHHTITHDSVDSIDKVCHFLTLFSIRIALTITMHPL